MAKKKKFYVVWEGSNPGIYDSWEKCQLQIKGYPNARYKSFASKEEAESAFYGTPEEYYEKKRSPIKVATDSADIVWESISVDAACSGNPGVMEYRGVDTKTKAEIFHQGPFQDGTNNVGEFLALVHALAMFQKAGLTEKAIYSDSKTAMAWVRNKKAKTNLARTSRNAVLFQLITRAETWLKQNHFKNPILKWETEDWGEIPADFGRK